MIDRIDHLVLTVKDIEATCHFYSTLFDMEVVTFAGNRKALVFGAPNNQQKINLHQYGNEFEPKAHKVQPGSADICFISSVPIEQITKKGGSIIEGPIQRTGAMGAILSIYLRDPDGNLLEVSNYLEAHNGHEKTSLTKNKKSWIYPALFS